MERTKMNFRIRSISILLGLILSCSLLSQEQGTISVSSDPTGCWVRVDSILVGKTPLNNFELAVGSHVIQIYPPNNGVWNLQERVLNVSVTSNQDVPLNVVFSSPVFINSIPYGAQLFNNETPLGFAPLYLPFEENKGKRFRLEKEGYKPFSFTLTTNQSILAEMEKAGNFKDEKEQTRFLGVIPKRNLKSKFTLLAVSIATNWASFYFKNVADNNFERYQQTADPQLMDHYWKQTQKYDRMSEIALGVSITSLAGLIYFVIWK